MEQPLPTNESTLSSHPNAKSLVCTRCWDTFFSTPHFQDICLQDPYETEKENKSEDKDEPEPHQKATKQQIRTSALNNCNWCLFLLDENLSESPDPDSLDDILYIRFTQIRFKNMIPHGSNTFYIEKSVGKTEKECGEEWGLELVYGCTREEDEASEVVTAREINGEVGGVKATLEAKKYLENCVKNHPECRVHDTGETLLPVRVIEVSPSDSDSPRLLTTKGERGRYATLSYCWGSFSSASLTTSNFTTYTSKIQLSTLPQSLQDAITITQKLNIPYIWIDALCIIQDSSTDKATEISNMENIYASSHLTIVAASSSSSSTGFLYPRLSTHITCTIPFYVSPPSKYGTITIGYLNNIEYNETFEPINQRAWTLQEQLLSSRYLVYATPTLQWRCRQTNLLNLDSSLQTIPDDIEGDTGTTYSKDLSVLSISSDNPKKEFSRWLRIIHIYSGRKTSLASDRLTALSAIAKQFHGKLGPRYWAGVWEYRILWQLSWTPILDDGDKVMEGVRREEEYRAPSWSWASADGAVDFLHALHNPEIEDLRLYPGLEIIEVNSTLKTEALPLGEVTDAMLRVRTVLRKAWFRNDAGKLFWLLPEDEEETDLLEEGKARKECRGKWERRITDEEEEEMVGPVVWSYDGYPGMARGYYDRAVKESEEVSLVWCLPVLVTVEEWRRGGIEIGILLVAVEGRGEACFRRVGYFTDSMMFCFEGFEEREIMII